MQKVKLRHALKDFVFVSSVDPFLVDVAIAMAAEAPSVAASRLLLVNYGGVRVEAVEVLRNMRSAVSTAVDKMLPYVFHNLYVDDKLDADLVARAVRGKAFLPPDGPGGEWPVQVRALWAVAIFKKELPGELTDEDFDELPPLPFGLAVYTLLAMVSKLQGLSVPNVGSQDFDADWTELTGLVKPLETMIVKWAAPSPSGLAIQAAGQQG